VPTNVAGLPVGSVSVSGGDITVSRLLNSPRIIERRLGEAVGLRYWADQVLPNLGGTAGVVIYEEWDPSFATLDRKAEPLAPDAEVPLAGSIEGDVKMVPVEADGLGYVVTRDQENRNQRFVIDRKERGLAFQIADKFNSRAVAAITGAITAASRTYAAPDWSAIVVAGSSPTTVANWPHSTLALLKAQQISARIPFEYDGMIAHPLDVWRLSVLYQTEGESSLAAKLGLRTLISDNTGIIPRGRPILFSQGNAGGTVWEDPIQTEVIPEPRRRRKVVQSTGSAAYFIDNPYALLQLTGVATADGGS
jgi:hypothetical protein